MESTARPECGGNLKAIMALFILSIVGLLATAALLWCLAGFSRALKEKPKLVGLLIRVENNETSLGRQRKQAIIAFPDRLPVAQQASFARFRKFGSGNLLILAGLAMLLASSTGSPNLSRMTSAIFHSNSETQKAVFVELSEMRVQLDS
jgi:hypothetical protein